MPVRHNVSPIVHRLIFSQISDAAFAFWKLADTVKRVMRDPMPFLPGGGKHVRQAGEESKARGTPGRGYAGCESLRWLRRQESAATLSAAGPAEAGKDRPNLF